MKRRTATPAVVPVITLTEQGNRCMQSGQWREAVETYKQLLKQDPTGGWEPLLSEAYEKRAGELAGKAMFKEAIILLDNSDRLWSTPRCTLLRLNCLVALGRYAQAVAFFLQAEACLQNAYPSQFPVLQEYVAALLLMEADVASSVVPTDSPWHRQLMMARQALAAFCHPAQTDLEHHLRNIAVRSPFKPLRLILKALTVAREQPDKAREWMAAIPSASPWSMLADLVPLCAMDVTELLRRADTLSQHAVAVVVAWRGIDPEQWRAVRNLLSAPPARVLSALLNHTWSIPELSLRRTAFLLLVEDSGSLPLFERRFGPLDELEKRRLTALSKGHTSHRVADAVRCWQLFLNQLKSTPELPDHAMRVAVTHRFLAVLIGQMDDEDPRGLFHLEQSLIYDPGDRDSHRALLVFHKELADGKEHRRVLERALRQFPDDAEFLYESVQEALQNRAFKKASRMAKRLLTLDPLHAGVRREFIGACLAQARKQVKGGRIDLATKELSEAATWERADERDGVVRINQALLACLTERTVEANSLLEEGKQEAGGGVAACLRVVMEAVRMGLSAQQLTPFTDSLTVSARATPTRESLLTLVRVARDYVGERGLQQLLANLSGFWMRAASLDYTNEEQRTICHFLAKTGVYNILTRYAARGEKKWRDQYVFVYYRLLAKYEGHSSDLAPQDWERLRTLLAQAEAHQDHELVADLEDWLNEEDGFDFDEDEFPDFMPPFIPRPGRVTGEERGQMLVQMLTGLARMLMETQPRPLSRDEVRELLQHFLEGAPFPREDKKTLATQGGAIMEQVLDNLFSSSTGRATGRSSTRKRGRGGGHQQLEFDFGEP
ncbi:MAG: hypothetical protein HQL90_00440 [Magnetococcales bacterium]|nr:hypothetical protein [Magnetococcales bacterium]